MAEAKQKQAIEGASRVNAFKIDPKSVLVVGVDTKHKAGEHPLWDKRIRHGARRAIINSMKTFGWWGGVVTLRKEGKDMLVVDGRGRILAARVANEELEAEGSDVRVQPIALTERGEDTDIVTTMCGLNELRLEDDILEKGRKALQMIKLGMPVKKVAIVFDATVQAIEQWMKVPSECDPVIIEAIEQKRVSGSVALTLTALPREEQVAEFSRMEAAGQLSVAEAKKAVHSRAKPSGDGSGASGSSGGSGGDVKRIPLSALRKICQLAEKGELKADLDPLVVKTLRCLLGLAASRSVTGMSAALREVGYTTGPAATVTGAE